MTKQANQLASLTRWKAANPRSRGERGYVMLVILAMLVALSAVVYKIIPRYAFEAQRDREEELIFRGGAYRLAIQLYVRKIGRYPNSLDELVETNGTKFIRKLYKDPMTEDGEWRLIHAGPGGTFPDSKVKGGGGNNLGLPPSQGGLTDITGQGSQNRQNPPRTGQTFGGQGIAGVASMSEQESIRVWNDQTTYDKWEFLFECASDPLAQQTPACQQSPPGAGNPPGSGIQPGAGANPPGAGNPPGSGNPPGGGFGGPGRQGFPGFPGGGAPPGFGGVPNSGQQPIGIPSGAGSGGGGNQPGGQRRF